jgi:predicted enzyme related to lactoylglutathione lyase
MIKKIAFIAHPTRDMQRSKEFFGEILGLECSNDYGDTWAEFDTPDGKSIALDTMSPKNMDAPSVYMALETDDIDAEVARLKDRGVEIVMDVWSNEMEGRLICKMAIIRDPDGNTIMLHEMADWRAAGGQFDLSG